MGVSSEGPSGFVLTALQSVFSMQMDRQERNHVGLGYGAGLG